MSEIGVPTYCQQCGRANAATARRCMWCDVPLTRGSMQRFEPTRAEIQYLGGIDGLEDPITVRLTISSSGIEVRSLTPGSKMSKISAYSIIDARVVDGSTVTDAGRMRPPWWWWLVLGAFALLFR